MRTGKAGEKQFLVFGERGMPAGATAKYPKLQTDTMCPLMEREYANIVVAGARSPPMSQK